jgi:hemoglobin
MKTAHKGMGISDSDWQAFIGHIESTLTAFEVPVGERAAVLGFVSGLRGDIVE